MIFVYIFLSGFLLAALFVFLCGRVAKKFHIYDNPDSAVAIHKLPLPHLGGVGIFIAVWAALLTCLFFIFKREISLMSLAMLLITGSLAFSLGLWDDLSWKRVRIKYKPNTKFFFQVLVSGLISAGLFMGGVNIKFIPLGFVEMLLMIFYIFGGMNAVNMQDGVDGLAGGLVAISLAGFVVLSFLAGNNLGMMLSLVSLGAVLGFLIYNFPPASIFMGDSGSHFLGFLVATLAIISASKPYDLRWFVGPILIIGLPVADAAWAVGRRYLQGKKLFQGDREHFYDRMMQKGLSVKKTLLVCYLTQGAFVIGGVSLTQV